MTDAEWNQLLQFREQLLLEAEAPLGPAKKEKTKKK